MLANNNGWPGAAEDALFDAFPNPLGFPKSAFRDPLGSPKNVFPDPLGSPEEPAKNRRACSLPRRRPNKANPTYVYPMTLKKSPIGREPKRVAIPRLETSPTCVSWSDLRQPQTSTVVQARVSTGQIPRAIGGPGFEREKHVAPEPDG